MKRIKPLLILLVVLATSVARAQDVHFSQFGMSPLMLNPALSGFSSGDIRMYANFRTQWNTVAGAGAYRTFAGGLDAALGKATKFSSFAGLGVSFFSDQAGTAGFQTNRVDLTFAYHFVLSKRHNTSLSFGIQGAFNHRGFDPSKSTYDSFYDPSTGTASSSNGTQEQFTRTKVYFGDVGVGAFFSTTLRKRSDLYFGLSFNHLNQPSISFFAHGNDNQAADKLYMKTTLHGGISAAVSDKVWIVPNFFIMIQGPAQQYNIGTHIKMQLGTKTMSRTFLSLGLQARIAKGLQTPMGDAVIVQTRLDYRAFTLGLSYDINVSKLRTASSTFGAPEVALMYTITTKHKPRAVYCPFML